MIGAALLAGRAALKLGAGGVRVGLVADNAPVVDFGQPELMLSSAAELLAGGQFSVLVAGCGMGNDAAHWVAQILPLPVPLVLDADALNALAQHAELRAQLAQRTAATLFTPHPGEAARLLGCSIAAVQADRLIAVQQLAQLLGGTVVLKGAHSLCADRKQVFINHTGNPGMSAAGMGDVLAGITAALLAQGMPPTPALCLAVHLHGAAGDALAQHHAIGLTASELTDQARLVLHGWRHPHQTTATAPAPVFG